MSRLLNPELYAALVSAFGKSNVRVTHPGVPMTMTYKRDALDMTKIRLEPVKGARGQEFKLCCPKCNDRRWRLSINHRWGVLDQRTGTRNLWLANCYNEHCFSSYDQQRSLFDAVMHNVDRDKLSVDDKYLEKQQAGPVTLPGELWPLTQIVKKSPKFRCLEYLRDRMMPPELVASYGVSYCLTGERAAEGRLVLPIYENDKLVSWQARAIVDDGRPKYLSATNTFLANYWYNFDQAIRFKTQPIVEGAFDVMGIGPMAMGCFNKVISEEKLNRLVQADSETGKTSVYPLVLDPTQNEKDAAAGRPHHMDVAYKQFVRCFPKRTFKVWLPAGKDPGSLPRAYTRKLIETVGKEHGIDISWALHAGVSDE